MLSIRRNGQRSNKSANCEEVSDDSIPSVFTLTPPGFSQSVNDM